MKNIENYVAIKSYLLSKGQIEKAGNYFVLYELIVDFLVHCRTFTKETDG